MVGGSCWWRRRMLHFWLGDAALLTEGRCISPGRTSGKLHWAACLWFEHRVILLSGSFYWEKTTLSQYKERRANEYFLFESMSLFFIDDTQKTLVFFSLEEVKKKASFFEYLKEKKDDYSKRKKTKFPQIFFIWESEYFRNKKKHERKERRRAKPKTSSPM